MHIGLVIYGSLDTLSGGYLYDRKLVEMLQERGHHVTIVSLPWRNYMAHLRDNSSAEFFNRLYDLSVSVLLQDELNHPSLAWLNARLKRARPHLPLISIVHHLRLSEQHTERDLRMYSSVEKRYLNSVDAFIYNSQTTAQTVTPLLDTSKPSVIATPGGNRLNITVTAADVAARAQQDGPLKLLFLASVTPRKQLHVILEALKAVPNHAVRLTVIGPDDVNIRYTNDCRKLAASLACPVTFMGKLESEEVARQVAHHQVLVLPSSYEGFGIAYLEALGAGLPVIASASGAAREVIGDAGHLIPTGNAAELAKAITKFATDRQVLVATSHLALRRFQQFPTWRESMTTACEFIETFPR